MLNTVSESVFSRSAHFILELLQNAEDAAPKNQPPAGEIQFTISPNRIAVAHNGAPFTEPNVDAICGVRSTKKPELGTLGFLGIGFKSVFKVTDRPHLYSGPFRFKFDRSAHEDPSAVPWQIMPIWVDDADETVNSALTTFVLPFRSEALYSQTLEELKRIDVHIFLFLRWLRRLAIIDETSGERTIVENLGEQDGFIRLRKNGSEKRFVVVRRQARVPDEVSRDPTLVFYKRQNVLQREVVIAFEVDGDGNLRTVENASALGTVSSFLPLVEERSGAKFLVQADFLVQPGREAIQYELSWNRWLVGEAVEAAKTAIERFKRDPRWGPQFLPLFKFTSYPGQLAYEKLFGPCLKNPVLEYLRSSEVMPTAAGVYVRPDLAVRPEAGLEQLLDDADLPLLFGGRTDLSLIDSTVDMEALPDELRQCIREIGFGEVARNKKVLERRLNHPEWLTRFYEAMSQTGRSFRDTQRQGRRGRFESIENPIYVPTDASEIALAKGVHLRNIPKDVLELRGSYPEVDALLRGYRLLHVCLDSEQLSKFFAERTHVEAIDFDKICRGVFLPRVRVAAAQPPRNSLVAYTRLLQKGPGVTEPIWVLTKADDAKPSNQVFLGTDYSPAEDWERHRQYVPQLDFLSSEYLEGVSSSDISAWKDFFAKVMVRESGENNHVETFAMAFVEDKLSAEVSSFVPKNRQQVGYDREARRNQDNSLVRIEIKGRKKDGPIQLVGNEPEAARAALNSGESFWVCIVPGIPEAPQLWVVEDVRKAWTSNIMTVDVVQWRSHGRRVC